MNKKNKIISDNGRILVVQDKQGRTFKISKQDEWVLQNYWSISNGYVRRLVDQKKEVRIHQEILKMKFVKHLDSDMLNNTRDNIIPNIIYFN